MAAPHAPFTPHARDAARVRHRHTRREGRISPDPAPFGEVRVLFDGDARSRCVPAAALEYLEPAARPAGRR